jgi:C1A family cysteine protease/predicted secreted protein
MRTLRDKKTHRIMTFCLIMVLLISLGGTTYAAPPAAPPGPQEIQVAERETGQAVEINGEVLVLNLKSNPSTGYGWQVQGLPPGILRQLDATEWVPDVPGKLGGPGTEILRFAGIGKGRATLNLVYARPWETAAAPAKTFSLAVQVTQPSKNVSYPQPGAEELAAAAGDEALLATLPTAYNACPGGTTAGCTPVKNQGNCGSCWAFGTVGPLEQAIKIKDGLTLDLAEQYLVSCNTDGWGCSGGFWAHDYHEWKYTTGEPGPGAVYESDFPYTATDAACNPPHTHHETLADWVYIGNDSSVPSTAAIKQAIYDHGPVSAAVCVNSAFQSYTGGVFTGSLFCFSINHAIVLVGWDDTLGAWRLRNSWGPGWGEGGYMWIAYGKQSVGYSANYVVYNGSTPPTPPAAPTNLTAAAISFSQINLTWNDNANNETGFKIERSPDGTTWTQIATPAANVTTYSDTGLAASTTYYYQVRAYNGAGDSAYSNTADATTQALPAPPAAPTGLAATAASSSQINLTWTDNADNETGFKIERCTGAGCSDFAQIATVGAGVTSYSNTGLAASTSYSYRVRAYNAGGDSEYSNTASAVTQAASALPAAPTNLTATAVSRSQINLTWMDNSSNETGFKIERCKGSTCTNFSQIATAGANVAAYSNTGLSSNTTYRYRVRAYNASGNSAYSNIAAATTPRR